MDAALKRSSSTDTDSWAKGSDSDALEKLDNQSVSSQEGSQGGRRYVMVSLKGAKKVVTNPIPHACLFLILSGAAAASWYWVSVDPGPASYASAISFSAGALTEGGATIGTTCNLLCGTFKGVAQLGYKFFCQSAEDEDESDHDLEMQEYPQGFVDSDATTDVG